MAYEWDFAIVLENLPVLLRGLGVMLQLWLSALAFGLAAGFVIALGRMAAAAPLRLLARCYVELFRNTPALIQLIWFYYAFPIVIGVQLTPFAAAVIGLSLNTSAYAAEIFRGGMQAVPRGQWEGASALGMTHAAVLRRVVLPQVLRLMLPAFTNRAIELAKTTSLASVLAVQELMYQGRLLSATYYRPMEILTTVALIYFMVIWPGSLLSAWLERRLARHG
ncbi:amino acid ABC transporter permease [Roseomonas hellenica]|uniref:Amino acid ABC transporter permease n=1 Tax=Plastoroseomonas hellenica TaxID=2687306 RepID=A0ABS5F3D3_9PROT|nr:amino acid ABC transporter permease [Plastoroseomonas hellenica]MBR0667069.1 amino acid ABC transporter permease [Plastoroseomonas hellenica]